MDKPMQISMPIHVAAMLRMLLTLTFVQTLMPNAIADEIPAYKPSTASVTVVEITTNAYGQSRLAPNALGIGERAPDFLLPLSGGGEYRLREQAVNGPVALVFYRGHW